MGKSIPWVREEPPTGRLIYRRAYPEDVRPHLPKAGQRELKVPLGARGVMTAEAFSIYEQAKARFDHEVAMARAAVRVEERRKARAALDPLTAADVEYISNLLVHNHRQGIDALLEEGLGELFSEAWGLLLPGFKKLRVGGDTEHLIESFGPALKDLMDAEGIWLDPNDTQGLKSLAWACSQAFVRAGPDIVDQFEGGAPPVPPKPERPANPRGRKRTVTALVDAYVADKWEGWSTSTRKAFAPVSRVLKDTLGEREVTEIDRDTARNIYQLVQALPVNMSKLAVFKGMGVREAVEEAKRRKLPTIAPKTINEGYMVHIAGVFNWARREEWTSKSPFEGFRVVDPVHTADKRDPFTSDQLRTLFSSAPWEKRLGNDDEKPGRYWVPLIALLSGMRMGEIAGLRLRDVGDVEGIPAFLVRRYEGRGC